MSDAVKIGVTSRLNITFDHELDTGISPEDWAEMSTDEQDREAADLILSEAVDWTVVGP